MLGKKKRLIGKIGRKERKGREKEEGEKKRKKGGGKRGTVSHASFGWFFRNWLVWENPQPYLSATLYITSHSNTRCLNLAICNSSTLKSLQSKRTEIKIAPTKCGTAHSPFVAFTILDFLRHQHIATTSTLLFLFSLKMIRK